MTLRELAKEAGVHFSTVSLALRDHPRIPAATREKIKALAHKRGYLRNPLVGQMMAQRRRARTVAVTESIAWLHLIPKSSRQPVAARSDENFAAAVKRATDLGYRLELLRVTEEKISTKRVKEILRARNVRGVIIGAGVPDRAHLSLNLQNLAPLLIGHTHLRPMLHRISHDHQQGIRMALHEIRRRGYQRIGLVLRKKIEMRIDYQWSSGFLLYRRLHPALTMLDPWMVETYNKKAFRTWLRKHSPDVILSSDNRVLEFLSEEGLLDRVGFVHLDSGTSDQPCAGVHQNNDEVGPAAVEWIVDQLQNQRFGIPVIARVILVEGTWHDGPTLKKPRIAAPLRV